ncbi:MAG TPA: hypothetical protein ACHBX0_13490 [Arsenophonus sp.]
MCYGWHSYQNKQMDLFDKSVWAEDEKEAQLTAMQMTVDAVKVSSDPNQNVHINITITR